MNETNINSFLEKESIGKLMGKYSIPCIISLLVAALYNIVNQIFIANASYLGSYGNAANTVVFPLTVIALAIAVMIGDGCCAYVSICLGAQNRGDAHRSIGNAVILCVAGSLVLTTIYFLLQDPVFIFGFHWGMMGAANESSYYTEFALKAFRVYLCMMVLACVNIATFIYLQSLGKALLSILLSMVREVVFGVGFALLLPIIFGLDGVLYSMPVSDFLTFLISAAAIVYTYRSLNNN